LSLAAVLEADLEVNMMPNTVKGFVGSSVADGHMVTFVARVTMNNGQKYEMERTVFVAPHDPEKEQRRAPEKWGP